MSDPFRTLLLTQDEKGLAVPELVDPSNDQLPAGDILVGVEYSGLSYKDGLAITGKRKVVRTWPLVPGIDLAETVLESSSLDCQTGDKVLLMGLPGRPHNDSGADSPIVPPL